MDTAPSVEYATQILAVFTVYVSKYLNKSNMAPQSAVLKYCSDFDAMLVKISHQFTSDHMRNHQIFRKPFPVCL